MLFGLPRQTDHLISDASNNSFVVACEFPESNLSILPDQVLPNRTSGCRVMSQAQVLCEKMVISAWVLEFAWVVGADFACQMKISCHINRDLFVTSFLGVENCSPANVVVALVDFTQGVSCTLKHLRWFLKQNVWFPHLDMFSNTQVMCAAWTHSCMDESLWATHSIGEKWWHVFAPVVMEPLFCCRKLFLLVFFCSSSFT